MRSFTTDNKLVERHERELVKKQRAQERMKRNEPNKQQEASSCQRAIQKEKEEEHQDEEGKGKIRIL